MWETGRGTAIKRKHEEMEAEVYPPARKRLRIRGKTREGSQTLETFPKALVQAYKGSRLATTDERRNCNGPRSPRLLEALSPQVC